jgi:N-acetyl-anhydromuramyl-L-alanine amidase AmpD
VLRPEFRKDEVVAYPFIESPNVTRTGGRRIDLIVLHTMEMTEDARAAENCAAWFRSPAARASAHYCVDVDSVVQCVADEDVAWHAPGANHDGIGIELAGRARQSRRAWTDPYSTAMLARSALLVADLCLAYLIPATWLHAADLKAGKRGITTHAAVSEAFKRSTHSDPGPNFPFERYVAMVHTALGSKGFDAAPLKPAPSVLRRGASGWQVKRLQRLLRQQGLLPEPARIDGAFGPITEAAVKAFQELHGLEVDGIVGPLTWGALLTAEVVADGRLQPV